MAKKKKSATAQGVPGGKSDNDYRAESDARTLTDAEAIRSDPKRLSAARGKLEHSVTALRKAMSATRVRGRSRKRGMMNGRM